MNASGPDLPPEQPAPSLFAPRPADAASSGLLPWAAAVLVLLAIAGAALLLARRHPSAPAHAERNEAYAPLLALSGLQISESVSLSGGKSTFVDGRVRNAGDRTVTAATVQVAFANDEALPPQVITLPLSTIRTREPYVDTQPLAVAPLAPGQDREFRLIFEGVGANWNQQIPAVHVAEVFTSCNPCR